MAQNEKQGSSTIQIDPDPMTADEASEADDCSPGLQDLIGNRLRQYYDRRLSEPLPDKFASLLAQLGKSETKE
jgi:hypothetical protein